MFDTLASWMRSGSASEPQEEEVKPVYYEYRLLEDEGEKERRQARLEQQIDNLENYYYKETSLKELVERDFKLCSKTLSVDHYKDRIAAKIEIEKALSTKLTQRASDNYDLFCESMARVQKIDEMVEGETNKIGELRMVLAKKREELVDCSLKISEMAAIRNRKNEVLQILESAQRNFGRIVRQVTVLQQEGASVVSALQFSAYHVEYQECLKQSKMEVLSKNQDTFIFLDRVDKIVGMGVVLRDKCLLNNLSGLLGGLSLEGESVSGLNEAITNIEESIEKREISQELFDETVQKMVENSIGEACSACYVWILDNKNRLDQTHRNLLQRMVEEEGEGKGGSGVKLLDAVLLKDFFGQFVNRVAFYYKKVEIVEEVIASEDFRLKMRKFVDRSVLEILKSVKMDTLFKTPFYHFIDLSSYLQEFFEKVQSPNSLKIYWETSLQKYCKKTMIDFLRAQMKVLLVKRPQILTSNKYELKNLDRILRRIQKSESGMIYANNYIEIASQNLQTSSTKAFFDLYHKMWSLLDHVKAKGFESDPSTDLIERDKEGEEIRNETIQFLEFYIKKSRLLPLVTNSKILLSKEVNHRVTDLLYNSVDQISGKIGIGDSDGKDRKENYKEENQEKVFKVWHQFSSLIRKIEEFGNSSIEYQKIKNTTITTTNNTTQDSEAIKEDTKNADYDREALNFLKMTTNMNNEKVTLAYDPSNFERREQVLVYLGQLQIYQEVLKVFDPEFDISGAVSELQEYAIQQEFNFSKLSASILGNIKNTLSIKRDQKMYISLFVDEITNFYDRLEYSAGGSINHYYGIQILNTFIDISIRQFDRISSFVVIDHKFNMRTIEELSKDKKNLILRIQEFLEDKFKDINSRDQSHNTDDGVISHLKLFVSGESTNKNLQTFLEKTYFHSSHLLKRNIINKYFKPEPHQTVKDLTNLIKRELLTQKW